MFFLGAGFMLLEAKGVVHMALLFGSTWVVNSVGSPAILATILLSNLDAVNKLPSSSRRGFYALLVNDPSRSHRADVRFSGTPARAIASCAIVFTPVFFAS